MLVLGVVGLILIVFTIHDIVWTSCSAIHSGFITEGLTIIIAKAFWIFHLLLRKTLRQTRGHARKIFEIEGFFTLVFTILIWYTLFWTGWALIFSWRQHAVIPSSSTTFDEDIDTMDLIYYTGTIILTLGNGDFRPNPVYGSMQVITALAAGTGFLLISLTAAYIVSATQQAASTRVLSTQIALLGLTTPQILNNHYSTKTKSFTTLESQLQTLIPLLCSETQSRNTFPILFNFHSISPPSFSSSARIAALDETLTVLFWIEHGNKVRKGSEIKEEREFQVSLPTQLTLLTARKAITRYLDTLAAARILPTQYVPEFGHDERHIEWEVLKQKGIPLGEFEDLKPVLLRNPLLVERRKKLRALVESSGGDWAEDIWGLQVTE